MKWHTDTKDSRSCLGLILECLLRHAWSYCQIADSKLIIFNIHFHIFCVSSLSPCPLLHCLVACSVRLPLVTSCVHTILTCCVCSLWKYHCFCHGLFCFGCVVLIRVRHVFVLNHLVNAWVWPSPLPCLMPCLIHPVLYLCVPVRVCVDIFPDRALLPPEVFKSPNWISQI